MEILSKAENDPKTFSATGSLSLTQRLQGYELARWVTTETGTLPVHRLEAGATRCWCHSTVTPALELHVPSDLWLKLSKIGRDTDRLEFTILINPVRARPNLVEG